MKNTKLLSTAVEFAKGDGQNLDSNTRPNTAIADGQPALRQAPETDVCVLISATASWLAS